MVKDTLNSIFDNLKERTTNPFLGTLIVVWIFKNWTLVYGLFNFDKEFKLADKLRYISTYYNSQSFILNIVYVVVITLGVLVFTYCMLALSRFLTDTYDKRVIPYIAGKTDKSSVVLKIEYTKLQDIIRNLESRLEEERLAKVAAQNERDKAIGDLINIKSPADDVGKNTGDLKDDRSNEFTTLTNSILKEIGSSSFKDLIEAALNNTPSQKDSEDVKFLLRSGIIKYQSYHSPNYANYTITEFGRDFLRYWNNIIDSQSA